VDSKAECDQLNLAQETKTKNASAQLVQYRLKIREGNLEGIRRRWQKGFVKEMSFKSGVKDWLSMVLRLRQHNIGYTADGFYRSDDPTNSVKALKEGG